MKRRILQTIVALLAIVGGATAQTLSVASVETTTGGQAELVVSANGMSGVTALQFNLALPQGVTLNESAITKGEAASGHTLSVQTLDNGDRLVALYHTDLGLVSNGTLLRLPIVVGEQAGSFNGSLYTIRTATTESVSQKCADAAFALTVKSDVVLDEEATEAPKSVEGVKATVKRTIPADTWSTICLPFAMTEAQVKAAFGDDVQLGDFTGCTVDGETVKVNFTEADAIEANHPYIIKVTASVGSFAVEGVDIAAGEASVKKDGKDGKYNSFVGNYENGLTLTDGWLFLNEGKFYFSTGKTKMKAYRAYFDLAAAGVHYDSRVVLSFDETTSISDAQRSTAVVQRSTYYNLKGQRVERPAKGIYVKNGNKVIIK